ncbi:phenylacetate--CoA ligase family protein [Sutcliffiella horikoshii]|uniref:phenylacetate--CoA ligase family protein n=1 Tax=Sutcliffiella horikoshii TaxID=79883 RepID=UPI001F3EBED2|nr:phenylacetate--CoA ligase [Sutcliffiella horikoshii]MCG1021032.1 phenylacetate--CoA ligase [Sutcliffiella horikoshii]
MVLSNITYCYRSKKIRYIKKVKGAMAMILHDTETLSLTDMRSLQSTRLKNTIHQVFDNVPFYKQTFTNNNVIPSDIKTIQDIVKLPFTTKNDLRENYPFGLFSIPRNQITRLHASSGTSGKPTVVAYSKRDIEMWSDIAARAISMAGGKIGDILHNAYGYGLFTGGLGLHYGSERLGMMTVPVSGGNTERQIQLIQDFQPSVICGTPSYVLNIAEKMIDLGFDPKTTSLQYGIFGAEPWSEEMRSTLEEKLGIKACDIYGLSEVIGPGVAMECHEAQDGLHIAEDHFYVEVIDPDTMEVLSEGEVGELVFTSLTKEAMPIIRYRTGDVASIKREKCVCGRTTTKMSRVKGRVDDMLIIRGVNIFPSEIEHTLLQIKDIAPHYQIFVSRDKSLDMVEVEVEIHEQTFLQTHSNQRINRMKSLAREVEHVLKSKCYISVKANIVEPKTIPRSEGKAIRIIDKRMAHS